jgi:hypothetical protein|tara:strand:+ start:99 stop:491 length:393 start_codon:yes stop_codon:yes gene_type:complete
MINPKKLAEKLLLLRSRIEDWTHIHGWENMDNRTVRKNKEGSIVWKQTDWEFVDNMYCAVINSKKGFGTDYSFNKDTVKTWNKMWHRYKIDVPIENANLEPDWDQLQQMDWDDWNMDVTLGPDPAMGVKG